VPVYQYACTECGDQLEVRQSFTDEPLTECPTCDGRLRKVLSAVGVVFKGSGFYRTDSRKQPAETSAGTSSSSGESNGAGSKGAGSTAGSSNGSSSTSASESGKAATAAAS
jgi:putative FmdB family regulatory protein